MRQLFATVGQSIGVSASTSVLPMNIQCWFPLGSNGVTSLLSKGLSRVFSSTTIQKDQFYSDQSSLWLKSHICTWKSLSFAQLHTPWKSPGQNTGVSSCSLLQRIFPTQGLNPGHPHCRWILYQLSHDGGPVHDYLFVHGYWKNHSTIQTFVSKVISLLFNMLSRFVIAFLPKSKCFIISWLKSTLEIILEHRKENLSLFLLFPISLSWRDRIRCHNLCFLNAEF